MLKVVVSLLIVCVGIVAFIQTCRIKRRKPKNTRERFAFWGACLIWDLTVFSAAMLIPEIGVIEYIISILVPIELKGSILEWSFRITPMLIMIIILYKTVSVTVRTHDGWSGAISVRQNRLDAQSNINNGFLRRMSLMFQDSRIWLSRSKHQDELKQCIDYDFFYGEEQVSKGTQPWRLEFMAIYNILNTQANILPEHWHSQENCYIKSDGDKHLVVLICDVVPEKPIVDRFITYTREVTPECKSVIIAIKDNPENKPDRESRGSFSVQFKFKNNLLNRLIDFSGYYAAIKKELLHSATPGSDLTIADVYTPLECRSSEDETTQSVDEYIDNWLAKSERRQLAILGDFGQGKTVTSLKLTERLINSNSERTPILIRLRGKSPRNSNPDEILFYCTSQYGLNAQALEILNNNGRLLLILDGFDEMDYVGDADTRRRHFASIWKLATERTKIILTGRRNYFMDITEENSALGSNIPSTNPSHCDIVNLCMLSDDKIHYALRNVDKEVRSSIVKILETGVSPQFIDLIRRPSQLSLIVQIWKLRKMEDKYKNLTHACIIDEFLLGSYDRQFQKATETTYSVLSPFEREYFMMGIAMKMYSMQTTEIDKEIFVETVKQLVDGFPDNISKRNHAVLDTRNGKPLGAYYYENAKTKEAIFADIRTCGVLTREEALDKLVFTHKSFMDLLVAKCFYWKILPNNNDNNTMSRAVIAITKTRSLRYSDIGNRRLLAELIMHHIADTKSHKEFSADFRTMFHQCYRFVVNGFSYKAEPQKIFKKYCKITKDSNYLYDEEHQQGNVSRNEALRLLLFPVVILPIVIIAFIGKSIQTFSMYSAQAQESITRTGSSLQSAIPLPETLKWVLLGALAVILVALLATHFIAKYWQTRFAEMAGTALYAWYYGCLFEGFSDEIILKDFGANYAERFRKFVFMRES